MQKFFLMMRVLKTDKRNNPRIFANSILINENVTSVQKGVLTYCEFRENEKCPPWELRLEKLNITVQKKLFIMIEHFLKIYDFPIFYFPKFSHPDPTVDRRSGF